MSLDPIRPAFLDVLPSRVRRNYRGGALLEQWTQTGSAGDGDQPEDWIASTTEAKNPGLSPRAGEGLTRVRPAGGEETTLAGAIANAPDYFLGEAHVRARGNEIGFLAKLKVGDSRRSTCEATR